MRKFLVTNFTFVCLLSFINSSHTCSFLGMQKLRLKSSLLSQTIITWGGRGCWKLGMQITYQTLISGCKKSTIYFPDVQKVWAHMCTLCIRLALPYHVISNSYFEFNLTLFHMGFCRYVKTWGGGLFDPRPPWLKLENYSNLVKGIFWQKLLLFPIIYAFGVEWLPFLTKKDTEIDAFLHA